MIRPFVQDDKKTILEILRATNVFSDEEIAIAQELLEIYVNEPNQNDYEIFSYVDEHDKILGYVCIGPTPATQGTYDMYWIAVAPNVHSKGIGTALLRFTEEYIKKKNGYLLLAETSSTEKYFSTRAFYENKGFQLLARIRAYYKRGDDLMIYGKYL
jgi:aminoglycoside 6'-N-acetyltransferase I